jgi:hypothetical protein
VIAVAVLDSTTSSPVTKDRRFSEAPRLDMLHTRDRVPPGNAWPLSVEVAVVRAEPR